MKNEGQKHFLALMSRPGDYIFLDIKKLDIYNGCNINELSGIDTFTMSYTINEIMESIIRANIVNDKYINGTLVIQDNQKHKPLIVIDKNYYNGFQIDVFLKNKLNDKVKLNTIINKFASLTNDVELSKKYQEYLKNGFINEALNLLFQLPYLVIRKYMIYLIDLRNKELEEENKKELIRDKAA